MNTVSRIALFVTAACAASATVFAAAVETAKPGKGPKGPRPDAASLATHLAAVYVVAAPYDLNVNGALEATELEQLGDAIKAGTLTPPRPAHAPADVPTPPVEHILPRLAGAYASAAPYDANVDGAMSATEIAALQAAIEAGTVRPPAPGDKGGPGGPGGPEGKAGKGKRSGAPAE